MIFYYNHNYFLSELSLPTDTKLILNSKTLTWEFSDNLGDFVDLAKICENWKIGKNWKKFGKKIYNFILRGFGSSC